MQATQDPDAPILVTGATGFIGSHLALRLLGQPRPLRLLVRDPQRLHPRLREGAQVLRGDLRDPASLLPAVRGCAAVFHCAANVATWDSAEAYREANVDGVRNLLQALQARTGQGEPLPARLVHLSTVDVYGYPRQPADEDAPADGGAFGYGRSKAQGEALLRREATHMGLSWAVLRPTNVMGPRSPFIERIGDELRSGLMLRVGGGRADCGFLYVDNLVDCMLWAAQAPAAHQACFNVRDPVQVSWARFLAELRAGIGGKGFVLDLPEPVAEAAAQVLQAAHRLLRLRGEPLLHPLLVRMFGRSCAHSVQRLRAAGAPLGAVPYEQAMQRSVQWYQQERQAHARA
jgi:nucleoside-diphosphate-sugar epimerase